MAPSELPSDPPVYQDADATENAPATIQGMHVLPSEELDDGDSEWNDENVEDMENATPAQHRASSGSQVQPLEPVAVPHVRSFIIQCVSSSNGAASHILRMQVRSCCRTEASR